MTRKFKPAALIVALSQVRSLAPQEMQQIHGGYQATLLQAMGWKSYTSNCLDKNGMSGTQTVWVKGDIIVGANGGKCA